MLFLSNVLCGVIALHCTLHDILNALCMGESERDRKDPIDIVHCTYKHNVKFM